MRATKPLVITLVLVACLLAMLPVFGALTSSIQVTIGHDHTASVGLSTAKDSLSYSVNKTFSNGSGTTQVCDLVYHGSRTLTTGANETLDLTGGLTDAYGNALNFVRLKSLVIEQTSASMTLTVGNAAAPVAMFSPATATVDIKPSGAFSFVFPLAGVAIATGTSDGLKIANSSGDSSTYKIWIVGTSY